MAPCQYIYRKNICPENSVKKFFDEKIFGRKFFSQLGKKFSETKKVPLWRTLCKSSKRLNECSISGVRFSQEYRYSGAIGGSFFSVFLLWTMCRKKVVRRAKSLHRSSHRNVLFLASLNATSQRSVPFLALLGADVWWRCCCCWFVLPRCDAEWVRFFVAPLNGIRNFLSAKRRFEGGSNVVDVDDASKIGGKKSVKKSGKNVGQKHMGEKRRSKNRETYKTWKSISPKIEIP